jgi:restriction modification system DNA specificity domain protein
MDSITMTTEQQLLKGWKKYNLFDICQPKQWKTIAVKDLKNEGYPVYGANGIIGFHNEFNHEKETLLIGCRGSCGEVHISQPKSYINGNAMCLDKLSDNISLHYLYYFLKGYNFKPIISGSTQPQITQIGLKKVEIPTPTLETQQAIVNKIESLFDEIDEGIGRLKTAAQQIQQYRQSLLKNAFNGELTKEWRSKHADTLPSENELLAQIQTTREQHHAQQLADWQTAVSQWEQNGKEGKKPSKPKASTQAVKFEENVADLPSGWGTVRLENLASEYVLGKMLDKNKNKGEERPYLGNINVRWGYFEFSNAKTMKIEDDEIERYSVKYGDLIICEGGEPGRCAVWKHEAEMFIQKALHRVRFPSYYSADFAFYYLSYAVKLPLVTDLLTGTTIKHLTGTALKNIPFPVCSISEQTQIVAILESKLTACDQLAAELAKQLKQADLLKQAVLKAAFSGELRE